jgi:hypothetical protein
MNGDAEQVVRGMEWSRALPCGVVIVAIWLWLVMTRGFGGALPFTCVSVIIVGWCVWGLLMRLRFTTTRLDLTIGGWRRHVELGSLESVTGRGVRGFEVRDRLGNRVPIAVLRFGAAGDRWSAVLLEACGRSGARIDQRTRNALEEMVENGGGMEHASSGPTLGAQSDPPAGEPRVRDELSAGPDAERVVRGGLSAPAVIFCGCMAVWLGFVVAKGFAAAFPLIGLALFGVGVLVWALLTRLRFSTTRLQVTLGVWRRHVDLDALESVQWRWNGAGSATVTVRDRWGHRVPINVTNFKPVEGWSQVLLDACTRSGARIDPTARHQLERLATDPTLFRRPRRGRGAVDQADTEGR